MRARNRMLRPVVAVVIALVLLHGSSFADSIPVEGDILLYFTSLYDQQGNHTGYRYDGAQASLKLNANIPVIIPIGIKDASVGQPGLFWSEVSAWNNWLLPLTNAGNIVKAIVNDGVGQPSFNENWKAWDALVNGGPTEKTLSQTIVEIDGPGWNVSFGAGLSEKFDVYLVDGVDILMDQTVVLEKLTVYPGAKVTGNNTFVTRTDLDNRGVFQNLMGIVEGAFRNEGLVFVTNDLFTGEGSVNAGDFEWLGGTLSGSLTNTSDSFVVQSTSSSIGEGGVLSNTGTITHTDGAIVSMNRQGLGSRLDNFVGGVYEFEGDGYLGGDCSPGSRVVTNAGIIRKTGNGTATIGSDGPGLAFINTGVVEVTSGMLVLRGGGSNHGLISATNGGEIQLSGDWPNSGVLSADGGDIDVLGALPLEDNGSVLVTSDGRINIGSSGSAADYGEIRVRSNGLLTGTGCLEGIVINDGTISPGSSPGLLEIVGDYTQIGTLEVEILGAALTDFDRLAVSGSATLGGTLDVTLLDGAFFDIDDTFEFLTAGSIGSVFDDVILPTNDSGNPVFALSYGPDYVMLTAIEPVPEPGMLSLMVLGGLLLLVRRKRHLPWHVGDVAPSSDLEEPEVLPC